MNDWADAFRYFRTAAQLCAGAVLPLLALGGAAATLWRRKFWPLALLALPGVFYVWSVHSSGTPIFVPTLPPFSLYNTRYGLAALPLLVVAAAGLVTLAPQRARALRGRAWWWPPPRRRGWRIRSRRVWVAWEESRVNSETRLAWTDETAAYLGPRYRSGAGILTSFGDMTGVYRRLGIPLRDTFTGDNGLFWLAAVRRPELLPAAGLGRPARGRSHVAGHPADEPRRNPLYSGEDHPGERSAGHSDLPALIEEAIVVSHEAVTTAFELPGCRIRRNLGIVRGIVVRSRSILGTFGAGLQTIVGGNITLFSRLCEQTRQDAFDLMIQHASELGANAIVGARYDATEIMNGVTEVLSYGTAVVVEPVAPMKIPFTKAHGAKNDFLLTWRRPRARARTAPPWRAPSATGTPARAPTAGFWSRPRWTTDADGAIELYNSDGSTAEISGNGTRCAAAFLIRHGYATGVVRVLTGAGLKTLRVLQRSELVYEFEMNMGRPEIVRRALRPAAGRWPARRHPAVGGQSAVRRAGRGFRFRLAAHGRRNRAPPAFPQPHQRVVSERRWMSTPSTSGSSSAAPARR